MEYLTNSRCKLYFLRRWKLGCQYRRGKSDSLFCQTQKGVKRASLERLPRRRRGLQVFFLGEFFVLMIVKGVRMFLGEIRPRLAWITVAICTILTVSKMRVEKFMNSAIPTPRSTATSTPLMKLSFHDLGNLDRKSVSLVNRVNGVDTG